MFIMLCDDQKQELENIRDIVAKYADTHPKLCIKVTTFSDPLDFIKEIHKNGSPDIAFLDICMPGITGTEIAQQLRKINQDSTSIVFLTTSADYAVEAFSLRASDYIQKPYTEQQIFNTLDRIIEEKMLHQYILVKCDKEIHRMDIYDLVFAETKHNFIDIHLHNGSVLKTRISLIKFSELFAPADGFTLVGASYFINLRAVKGIYHETLEMSSGEILPIPRRLKTDLKLKLFDFYKKSEIYHTIS